MKSLISFLQSNKTSLVLLFIFGATCGYATFVENDYGTPAVRAMIFDTWWFELIMGLLAVNFLLNIKKYRLFRWEKASVFLFHLGFVVILIGAFISRYTGYEGIVHIREGQSTNYLLTNSTYITFDVNGQKQIQQITPTVLTPPQFDFDIDGVTFQTKQFIPYAERNIVSGEDFIITVVVAENNQRATFFMEEGQVIESEYGTIGFNASDSAQVKITGDSNALYIQTSFPTEYMIMATQEKGSFAGDTILPLNFGCLYRSGPLSFVVKSQHPFSKIGYVSTTDEDLQKKLPHKLVLEAKNSETQEITLNYQQHETDIHHLDLGGKNVNISLGPKTVPLGFDLFLKDFELIRYPGSTSPSSYSSYIQVQDGEEDFPYTIYMNNVLDHGGFRFFQASFDMDERGTVLSVNHDWWGTFVTYLGYFMLFLGMMVSMFGKNTRFQYINGQLKKLQAQKFGSAILFLFLSMGAMAQDTAFTTLAGVYPQSVSDKFGSVLIQDMDGRIKPVNTLASELTRKITGSKTFHLQYGDEEHTLDANQFFIAIHVSQKFWAFAPVIKIDPKKGNQILEALGKEDVGYLAMSDFFDEEGTYLIQTLVNEAYDTKPVDRSIQMEEVIKVDERFNILYRALTDSYMKLFPKPGDVNHAWYSDKSVLLGLTQEDSVFVKNIIPSISTFVFGSNGNADFQKANDYVGYLSAYQERYASDIIPSESRVQWELRYNKWQIFFHLFYTYWLFGLILFTIAVIELFYRSNTMETVKKGTQWIVLVLFTLHTANMIIRWFAGGYPPWSNGYEMMILVSWATVMFGWLLRKKSSFILPLASLFTGTLLFVAFLDWLNPEITSLVPVLKSYWLKIHVAVIVGSYAPLALSALLGFTALWIGIFSKKDSENVKRSQKEITYLNEISMTIGIYMLGIGTFLGGIWANESWGRYWGWDPKETWALISILAYAIVLHLRLIPVIKPFRYWLNLASVVAFFCIIMTSFGVNYYLSGLHSYAHGDPLPVPTWVYILIATVIVTAILSFRKRQRI